MIRIWIDCNVRDENFSIAIDHEKVPPEHLKVGEKVTLFEAGMECEAILRRGKYFPWAADIIPGTVRDGPENVGPEDA